MYSLGWHSGCDDCGDEADRAFVEAIAPMTHYISIDQLAVYSVACISPDNVFEVDVLDDNAQPLSASVVFEDANVTVSWERSDCGFYGCTELEVTYD